MSSHHAAGLKRNSHASTQPSPRRSTVGRTAKQRAANLRRTTVDRLAKTQQYRLRQLHHRIATRQRSPLRREGSVGVSPSNAAAQDDGSSARWKPAIKEVSVPLARLFVHFGCPSSLLVVPVARNVAFESAICVCIDSNIERVRDGCACFTPLA